MPWTETDSLSFTARFEEGDEETAERTLDELEDLRLRLEDRFDSAPGGITIVIHPNGAWLAAAHPFLPAARMMSSATGRRYLAGWATTSELHTLSDGALERRAAGPDSRRALLGTSRRLYAQIALATHNERMPPPWGPRAFGRYLRWAWLIEGASEYYAGQAADFRAAILRRLADGDPPAFPPSTRDAVILGGTVFGLLEEERGAASCDLLASRLPKAGPVATLETAFDASIREIEGAWREHVERVASAAPRTR
jgi:hypothetical protein